jgi:aspartyl-tRNA(Asn)/glutamyl-tRNA(Gln) amidotransferase subunit A
VTTPITIARAAADLRRSACTSTDLVEASLAAIDRDGQRTNAFIRIDADAARDAARAVDIERARGVDRGPLHGMPISIKDLVDVRGVPTTAASRARPGTPAAADAPIVTRLRDAGAVLIGKTNLHEFALGTTSDESAWGPVRHPLDPARSAGGSSGGSAAAVATGMGVASIGTDTGGSIRIPAAACGIVGLKPTFGEVSLEGVVPLSLSLDHAGPLALTVEDASIVWRALTGAGAFAVVPAPGLRLRRLAGWFDAPLAPEVRAAMAHALAALRSAGVRIEDATLPGAGAVPAAYVDLALPEAAAWHERHVDTRLGDYTPGVAARIARGREVPAIAYLGAQSMRITLRRDVDRLLDDADALILPTLPIVAPLLGTDEIAIEPGADRTTVRAAMLRHTQPFNLTGHPAISIPAPVDGLPVGIQLVGRRGETGRLLAVAAACEQVLGVR